MPLIALSFWPNRIRYANGQTPLNGAVAYANNHFAYPGSLAIFGQRHAFIIGQTLMEKRDTIRLSVSDAKYKNFVFDREIVRRRLVV